MQKFIIIFLIIISVICFIPKRENSEIRVRIIANSNELDDQINKIIVKEALVEIFEKYRNENITILIQNQIELIIKELSTRLKSELFETITVRYTNEIFPAKSINGKFLPSGEYNTLLIEIGDAKGKNWWSVLYPDFFEIEYDENNEIEYRIYLKDLFSNRQK